jgi:hypothetical protein
LYNENQTILSYGFIPALTGYASQFTAEN